VRSTVHLEHDRWRIAVQIALACAALAVSGYAQEIAVQNDSGVSVKVTAAEIAALPHQKVSVDLHGKAVSFDAVPLRLVLEKAGITLGDSLRGKRLSFCLLVEAADGYRVVFALPELDPAFTDRVILIADRADGQPIGSHDGPFRIVVPGEKKMARWVWQVTALKIVKIP
jgi:hypothetical protein